MKIKIALFLFSFLFLFNCINAYPIDPRPLRKLIIESPIIVIADVEDVEELKNRKYWQRAKAVLSVCEILKGELPPEQLEIYFDPFMACPAPARYIKNTTVLAFIYKREKANGYATHALSYGSKTLNKEDLQLYKELILEMIEIQKIENKKSQLEKTVDWLIKCASNKTTAWEGLAELQPRSDFMSDYISKENSYQRKVQLTTDQKKEIKNLVFSSDELGYHQLGMVGLVTEDKDQQLLDFLLEEFKNKKREDAWNLGSLMKNIAILSGEKELLEITEEYNKINYFDEAKKEKKAALFNKFTEELE